MYEGKSLLGGGHGGRWETGETAYEEGHGKCVEYEDEEEFKEVSGVWRETCHPIRSVQCSQRFLDRQSLVTGTVTQGGGKGTDIVDTTIVGMIRSGMTSKMKREKSHAVGLFNCMFFELHQAVRKSSKRQTCSKHSTSRARITA